MNAPRARVFSCVIKAYVGYSQTAFYDVENKALHLRGKPYNTELIS